MHLHLQSPLSFLVLLLAATLTTSATNKNPTFAFTYTAKDQDWASAVDAEGFNAVYVYAGDVEFYCEGSPTAISGGGTSPADLQCDFSGRKPNAFVYYTDFAKAAAAKFKAAGKTVYINFDGRITPKLASFVPNFGKLPQPVVEDFAAAVAAHVCDDPNVDGMAWDVEPFSNDQVPFFAALDAAVTACGKRWGVFAFGETFSPAMWQQGLGKSGFLFDSVYDLECTAKQLPPHGCQPCRCTPPEAYGPVLASHLRSVMASAKKYDKPYRLMVSGSGTTQLFTKLTTPYCSGAGGGPAFNTSCPYTMKDWMSAALIEFDAAGVKADPRFEGIGVYGWTTTDGGGFSPTTPPSAALAVLKANGYLPYANDDSTGGGVHAAVGAADASGGGAGNITTTAAAAAAAAAVKKHHHRLNACKDEKDPKSCPPHFMVGSPTNVEQ